MEQKVLLGPLLYFSKISDNENSNWNFSACLLVDGPADVLPQISITSDTIEVIGPTRVEQFHDVGFSASYFAWHFSVPRNNRTISYSVIGNDGAVLNKYEVAIPAQGSLPQIAFFSCNGVENKDKFKTLKDPHFLWVEMLRYHNESSNPDVGGPYQLLIGGGDQIYSDSVWELDELKEWWAIADEVERFKKSPLRLSSTSSLSFM